ncbi:MAG: hypothetical protein K6E64_09340 [Lachnospiraceae bacterium]|nr:hypothetical protein [Lachnospiraceae bacterium]
MSVIQHNLSAMNVQRQYNINGIRKASSTEKLSSGYRINRSADDAAGLSISEKMRWQIRGLDRSAYNIMDGVSLVQVAEGALNEVSAVLNRVRELSVQAANDTNTDTDRQAIQAEIDESIGEINRIATTTSLNEIYPLNADDVFALDAEDSVDVTPTLVSEGIYSMNAPGLTIDANGTSKTVTGFQFDLGSCTVDNLSGKTFFSTCAASCGQTFAFSFDNSIPISSSTNVVTTEDGRDSLSITIGLADNPSMEEVAARISQEIKNSSLYDSVNDTSTNNFQIGHANSLAINGTTLTFYPTSGSTSSSQSSHSATINGTTYSNLYMGSVYLNGLEEFVTISKVSSNYGLNIQAGALGGQAIQIPIVRMSSDRIGVDPLDVSSYSAAGQAIAAVDGAIEWVNETRANFGAVQNRLEEAYNVNKNTSENSQSAESRIRDTDMAKEMVNYSAASILEQASQAMMVQANQIPQGILNLLQ